MFMTLVEGQASRHDGLGAGGEEGRMLVEEELLTACVPWPPSLPLHYLEELLSLLQLEQSIGQVEVY